MIYRTYEELPDEIRPLVDKIDGSGLLSEEEEYINQIRQLGYQVETEYGEVVCISKDETPEAIDKFLYEEPVE